MKKIIIDNRIIEKASEEEIIKFMENFKLYEIIHI